jgi:hypothetical protein
MTDPLRIDFFTKKEAYDLFDQFQKEYDIEVKESIINDIFTYTSGYHSNFIIRHPGLFCLCGRILQSIIDQTKQKEFSLKEWEKLISEGILIEEIKKYPTTKRIIYDFNKNKEIVKNARGIFKEKIILNEEYFYLDPSIDHVKFLLNEGLVIPYGDVYNYFKITSPMIKDLFGVLLIEKSNTPDVKINLNDFKFEKILEITLKNFNINQLTKYYEYCSKINEDQQTLTCNGLKESIYQYELTSIFRNWFSNEICVQASTESLKKFPDIFLFCKNKFKIILVLLSNERYTKTVHEKEVDSSILGHIKRTFNYGKKFNAIPWIINFVTLQKIEYFDQIKYPGENNDDNNNNVNIVYIFHDKNFDNIKMKFTKIGEETKLIDIKIKE